MLKFTATGADGQKVVMFGLSEANILAMQQGKPVHVLGADVELEHDLVIFTGPTEERMIEDMRQHGLVPDNPIPGELDIAQRRTRKPKMGELSRDALIGALGAAIDKLTAAGYANPGVVLVAQVGQEARSLVSNVANALELLDVVVRYNRGPRE